MINKTYLETALYNLVEMTEKAKNFDGFEHMNLYSISRFSRELIPLLDNHYSMLCSMVNTMEKSGDRPLTTEEIEELRAIVTFDVYKEWEDILNGYQTQLAGIRAKDINGVKTLEEYHGFYITLANYLILLDYAISMYTDTHLYKHIVPMIETREREMAMHLFKDYLINSKKDLPQHIIVTIEQILSYAHSISEYLDADEIAGSEEDIQSQTAEIVQMMAYIRDRYSVANVDIKDHDTEYRESISKLLEKFKEHELEYKEVVDNLKELYDFV